ncbi:MAG: SCO1664 family protein [Actinomycetota bacterium]|jgi:uncharacterized repeat protein (TIGR03843 family)
MNELLEHLEFGELEVTGRLVDASNATLYASCTYAEKSIPVIYKPVAGERPLWDFPDGNLAQREYAAYRISEIGKFSVVPPTVLRDGPFGVGMVQQWIDIDEEVDLAEFYRTDDPRLRKMALFDAVINNTDRKIGHLLPTVEGDLRGCDHGVTFHEEDKLRTVLWQWADKPLTEEEKAILQDLLQVLQKDPSEILELITEDEFDALVMRIQRLLEQERFPSPSEDWPAVPWPPF